MKEKILKLRGEGKTYAEIKSILNCAKSTISYYCGDNQKEKSNARVKKRRSAEYIKKERRKCKSCGGVIKKNRIYCNEKCNEQQKQNKFESGLLIKNATIKKRLIKIYGNKCSDCGIGSEWNKKPLSLQVDHVDGNSDSCIPSNVRLLCPNCHSQTETFCGGKKNKKHTKRNKYLQNYKRIYGGSIPS